MASFNVPCPSCESGVLIKNDTFIGKKVECPKCKYRFVVEEPNAGDAPKKKKKGDAKKLAKKAKGGSGMLIGSIIGVVAIIVYVASPAFGRPLTRVGFALMLAGALGNLADRIAHGEVTDFIKVPHWPAFNVADSSITIGVALLLWTLILDDRSETESSN